MALYDALYRQSTGDFYLRHGEGGLRLLARGYAGYMAYANRPAEEWRTGKGPLPRGVWAVGLPYHHPRLGPLAFPIQPVGHNAQGRSGFFIHGDNSKGDRSGSHGCIVLGRAAREALHASRLGKRGFTLVVES